MTLVLNWSSASMFAAPPQCLPSSSHSPASDPPSQSSTLMEREDIDHEHGNSSTRWERQIPMSPRANQELWKHLGKGTASRWGMKAGLTEGTFELGPEGPADPPRWSQLPHAYRSTSSLKPPPIPPAALSSPSTERRRRRRCIQREGERSRRRRRREGGSHLGL